MITIMTEIYSGHWGHPIDKYIKGHPHIIQQVQWSFK